MNYKLIQRYFHMILIRTKWLLRQHINILKSEYSVITEISEKIDSNAQSTLFILFFQKRIDPNKRPLESFIADLYEEYCDFHINNVVWLKTDDNIKDNSDAFFGLLP